MSKIIQLKKYDIFHVGMKITIVKDPRRWSSTLNGNYLEQYPYICVIKEIAKYIDDDHEIDHITMTDGKYGFLLANELEHREFNLKYYLDKDELKIIERREKLKKLKKYD